MSNWCVILSQWNIYGILSLWETLIKLLIWLLIELLAALRNNQTQLWGIIHASGSYMLFAILKPDLMVAAYYKGFIIQHGWRNTKHKYILVTTDDYLNWIVYFRAANVHFINENDWWWFNFFYIYVCERSLPFKECFTGLLIGPDFSQCQI